MKNIYLDSASTTPVDPDVLKEIEPYFTQNFGNPSSLHSVGRTARKAIEKAREQASKCLNCKPEQIFFTGSATEADNWAIQILEDYLLDKGDSRHKILYLPTEHKAVLNSLPLESLSLMIDKNGVATLDVDMSVILGNKDIPVAITCMWINNETGSIQPIEKLSDFCYENNIPLHVDATQALGKLPISLERLKGITTLAVSGHKVGSIKGGALLFIRDPKADYVKPLIYGGGQEKGLRAGTENVPAIVGIGAAMEKISKSDFDNTHVCEMNKLLRYALSAIPKVQFNSSDDTKICDPHYLNVSFYGVEGEALELALDRRGICVSAGSACNSGSLEPSHVLKAIRVLDDYINGTIRISLSESNTLEECEYVARVIKEEVAKLRSISPTWKGE